MAARSEVPRAVYQKAVMIGVSHYLKCVERGGDFIAADFIGPAVESAWRAARRQFLNRKQTRKQD